MNNPTLEVKACQFEHASHCRHCTMKDGCSIYLSWNDEHKPEAPQLPDAKVDKLSNAKTHNQYIARLEQIFDGVKANYHRQAEMGR